MSKHTSIQRLPVEVDPFRLVEQSRILDGNIPVGDFPRLKELLFDQGEDDEALVRVHLEFTRTDTRLPVVVGQISADLFMLCQRCLSSAIERFDTDFSVVFVSSDQQAEKLQEGHDTWLVEDQRLFLRDFIEDEILLALPLVVSHESCEPVKELIEARPQDSGSVEENVDEKVNPFAALKDLKLN